MITVTDSAATKVSEFIGEQSEPFAGIRVVIIAGGCSGFEYRMNLENEERPGDQIVEANGFKVFVDEQSMLYLDGTVIDFVESAQGSGFAFNNPNVQSTCGCGDSFQV